jgi:hypothetical protein
MLPERRIVLEPIADNAAPSAAISGGPFVTGLNRVPDVALICGTCGLVAIIVPITAIRPEPSEKLGFRCNACGKYGVLPSGAGNAIQ